MRTTIATIENLGSEMLPAGYAVVLSILNRVKADDFIGILSPNVDTTDDGGAMLVFEAIKSKRELTFVIPNDGSRRYFVAREPGYHLAGLIRHDIGIDSLFSWLAGFTKMSLEGLSLPELRIDK